MKYSSLNIVICMIYDNILSLLPTVCIRIVADFGTRIFQFITKFYAGYNVHVYYYFGYYFYTLLGKVYSIFILFSSYKPIKRLFP
jgi:hypothetical protein